MRTAPRHARRSTLAALGLAAFLLSACESSNPAASAPDAVTDAQPVGADGGRDAGPDASARSDGRIAVDAAADAAADAAEQLDLGATDARPVDAADPDARVPDAETPDLGPQLETWQGTDPIYEPGSAPVRRVDLAAGESGAPLALVAFVPDVGAAAVPVVVFQHGFLMSGNWYSEVLQHLASHGFLVVAPQMYAADNLPFGKPSSVEEARSAAAVLAWLERQAEATFAVSTDRLAPGLAGHSRGGKVIWTLMNTAADSARAIAGVDPVDGTGGPLGGESRILDLDLQFAAPALVLGTGLGGVTGGPFAPACAPEGDSYARFVERSPGEVWHSVATDFGHNDVLDPNPPGCLVCGVCPGGPQPVDFRRFVAGQLTAFFRGHLQGVPEALDLIDDPSAPVTRTIGAR